MTEALELRQGGVLELIDQDVPQRQPRAQRELGRLAGLGERCPGGSHDEGVVDPAGLCELLVQLAGGAREHPVATLDVRESFRRSHRICSAECSSTPRLSLAMPGSALCGGSAPRRSSA